MPLLVVVRRLAVINDLIKDGTSNVASSCGTLAGVETSIGIQSLAFVDPDLPDEVGAVYTATIDLDTVYGESTGEISG